MSCKNCLNGGMAAAESAGLTASQLETVWAMVWQYLPRCPYCSRWVSPRTGICRYAKCKHGGEQVVPLQDWRPAGVRFTTRRDLVGLPAPALPARRARPARARPPAAGPEPAAQAVPAPVVEPAAQPAPAPLPVQPTVPPQPQRRRMPIFVGGSGRRRPAGQPAPWPNEAPESTPQPAAPMPSAAPQMPVWAAALLNQPQTPLQPLPSLAEVQASLQAQGNQAARPAESNSLDTMLDAAQGKYPEGHPVPVKELWGQFEYGGEMRGQEQALPVTGVTYKVGDRYKVDTGVGAREGRNPRRATSSGACLPLASDLMANAVNQFEQQGSIVFWHGEVTPGGEPFGALYDVDSHEAACLVPGCPGQVFGRPCPHQMGAAAAGVMAQQRRDDPLRVQYEGAVEALRRGPDKLFTQGPDAEEEVRRTAITAGDCGYALLKERGPDEYYVGSQGLIDRARAVFMSTPPPQPEPVPPVAQWLGMPKPAAPSQSNLPPAQHDPNFVIGDQAKRVLRTIGAGLRLNQANPASPVGRCFGLYGPPGTGKNTIAQETAATLGIPYREIDLGRGSNLPAMIGEVVLEPDGKGGTRSVARLGTLGEALVKGEVLALNEGVHLDENAVTILHGIIQNGRFQINSPEGADVIYQVHPASMVFMTWNPQGGKRDRLADALMSRLTTAQMSYPPENEEIDQLQQWSTGNRIPGVDKDKKDATRTVRFVRDLRSLAEKRGMEVAPSLRHAQQFMAMWKLTNDPSAGLEQMRVLTSQSEDHQQQWAEVEALYQRHFGGVQ